MSQRPTNAYRCLIKKDTSSDRLNTAGGQGASIMDDLGPTTNDNWQTVQTLVVQLNSHITTRAS